MQQLLKAGSGMLLATRPARFIVYVADMDGDRDLDVVSTTNVHPAIYDSEVAWFQNNLSTGEEWKKIIISSSDADKSYHQLQWPCGSRH